jgi:hypothetical protein
MDWPCKIYRKDHRAFLHDPLSAIAIAESYYPGDPDAVTAALLHIYVDQQCSEDPQYKKLLEKLTLLDKRKGRRKKEKTTRTSTTEKHFLTDMKKVVELKKLYRILCSQGRY